jgi:soluble lytic murein transglycosylase-like protein
LQTSDSSVPLILLTILPPENRGFWHYYCAGAQKHLNLFVKTSLIDNTDVGTISGGSDTHNLCILHGRERRMTDAKIIAFLDGLSLRSFAKLSAAVLTCFAIGLAAPAEAKKKPKEPPPCPVEGTLRVADADSIKGLESLKGCTDVVESPPDPPRSAPEVIEIDGGDESPYVTNMDQARPSKKKARRAGGDSADSDYPVTLTSAGGVRMIRIVPDQQEVEYAPSRYAASAASTSSAPADVKGNPEAILGMRPGTYSTQFDNLIEQVARRHRIDPLFLHAVIKQESGYRPAIGSHAGAKGLMQIMPATGRTLGLHPSQLTDPAANVDAGARLLRKLHKRYNGNFTLMLAAYNAGEGAVAKYGNRVPPYRETQHYVKVVMAHYYKLVASARSGGTAAAK